MRKGEALAMLREAFGPGDIAGKLNKMYPADFGDFSLEQGDELIEWIAEQLTDEEDEDGESRES